MRHNCIRQLHGAIWQSDKSSSHFFAPPPPDSTFLRGFFSFDSQHQRPAVSFGRRLDSTFLDIDLDWLWFGRLMPGPFLFLFRISDPHWFPCRQGFGQVFAMIIAAPVTCTTFRIGKALAEPSR